MKPFLYDDVAAFIHEENHGVPIEHIASIALIKKIDDWAIEA